MRPRVTFMLGGAAILGVAAVLMASAIRDTATYYLTPQELAAKTRADPTFFETGVKLGARVVRGSIVRAPGGREVDVVVEGRLGRGRTFRATHLFAKCGSRYESAPEKYRQTPGYKRASQAGA